MLTITGPGPLWSSGDPKKREPRYKPKPAEYASFARAVATRYKDQVNRYLLWNEPNQKGWLQPQWEKQGRNWIPVSPHIYRDLVRAGQPAVKSADPGAEVVIGELAPVGNRPISAQTPMEPLPFLRSMGCVDDKYKSIKTGACKGFKAAQGDTLGYHPHPQKRAPDAVNKDEDQAQFGDLKRLFTTIDKLRAKQAGAGRQEHPPDRVRLRDEPARPGQRHLAVAADEVPAAGRLHRVGDQARARAVLLPVVRRAETKNLGGGTKRYSGWQTGLKTNDGSSKPVLYGDVRAVRHRPEEGREVRHPVGSGPSGRDGPGRGRGAPRGATEFREVARLPVTSDGVWTRRLTLTAACRVPLPVDAQAVVLGADAGRAVLGHRRPQPNEKSQYKAGLAPTP